MVKIQLEGGYLEVKEGTNCPLNFGVGDVRDVAKKTGTFSKTITLVGSSNNNNLLNHYYDVNIVEGTFNINALTKCTLLQNDVPIVADAYLQLLSVDKIQQSDSYEDVIEYQVLVKDAQSDFFTKIDNSLLEDIDLSYLNNPFTASNILASFSNTAADGYVYVLPQTPNSIVPVNEFKPAVYAKTYWDKIHQLAGFTYEWADLSDAYFDKLVIPYNGGQVNITYEDFIVEANVTDDYTGTQPVGENVTFYDALTGWTETLDLQTLFDPTAGTYDVPFNIVAGQSINFEVTIQYEIFLDNATGSTVYLVDMDSEAAVKYYAYQPTIRIQNGATTLNQWNQISFLSVLNVNHIRTEGSLPNGSTSIGTGTYTFTLPVTPLNAANILTMDTGIEIFTGTVGALASANLRWKATNSTGGTNVSVDPRLNAAVSVRIVPSEGVLVSGADLVMNRYIPQKVKQKDFIKSFCTMYNLFVEQDVDNPQKLIYRHRDEYYDSGAVKDWTLKLAKDRAQSLQFLPELSAKKLQLTYKPDNDEPNVNYENAIRETYGQVEFTFDNEYVKGIDRKELIFSPTPITINSFNAAVPMLGGTPKTNLRVLIHDGSRTCQPYDIVDYASITGYTGVPPTPIYTNVGELGVTTYPMVHHMNDPFNASFDINFAICDFYYYQNIGLTNNNLFNNYWRRTVNQINRGKMLSAYFDLEENDIQTLRLNDKIRIDNSWWNINRIQDYNANSRTLTKVELLSIDDELSLPDTRVTRPIGNADIKRAGRFIMESFYRNNNVNLSEGSVIVRGIGNVINEGLEGFVQGDYKVITENGYNGLNGGENFANTDLTFTGDREHNTDGNFLKVTTDNGAYNEGYLYVDPVDAFIGVGGAYVYADGSNVYTYTNNLISTLSLNSGLFLSNYGRRKGYVELTTTTTLSDIHHVVNCTSGTFTINLPTAVSSLTASQEYIIKNSGAGTITIDPDGAETIDGGTTGTLSPGDAVTIVSTGTNWIITSRG